MANEPSLAALDLFRKQYAHLIGALRHEAKCVRWGLSDEAFAKGLLRSVQKRFGAVQASPGDLESYLMSLHLEDLALACACAVGIEKAWDFFIAHFRHDLRTAASAMLRGSGVANDKRAEDLADSLYAELYGVRAGADGRRKSLFEYFHGRSKLSTWLRAVLAQKQVDMFRLAGKTVSRDAESEGNVPREMSQSTVSTPADPDRQTYLGRFERALSEALANLTPRERMLLACYYVDRLTLADMARTWHEHESTVSRQLERIRLALRADVTQVLKRKTPACDGRLAERAFDEAQVDLAFEYALEDWPFDLSQALSSAERSRAVPEE